MAEYRYPEHRNIAEDLEETELAEIAEEAFEDYKNDEQSRQEWMRMHTDWLRVYYQRDRPLNPPWEGSSTESVPSLAEGCTQFHARAFQAMFPNRRFIRGIPTGKTDAQSRERAERIGTHMSWQLLIKDKSYKRNKDRLLLGLPLHGSFFTKSYHCPVRKRNVVENVRPVDLVVPYGTGSRDLEDLDRKTQILWTTKVRGQKLTDSKFFLEAPEPYEGGEKLEYDKAHDQAQGIEESPYQQNNDSKILEQHRFLDLDGDGSPEPYTVWLDAQSEKVLRVSVRYDTDELGNPTADKEPVEYFTHYAYMTNPDGFYALGLGHLLGQLNICINKLMRQSVDAATLANVGNQSGFVSQQLALKKGELQMQLGKYTTVPGSMDDLRKGIMTMDFKGPEAALLQIMQFLLERADRLGGQTEALTGQPDKVMQPTTILALIEQGLQVFSTVYERVLGSWEIELEKLYRLNRKHLDPVEYFTLLDMTGELLSEEIGRDDYRDDYQVIPISDPRMTTERQKMARAQAEYQFAATNPLVVNSPVHFYNASRRYLEAIGSDNVEEILPAPDQILPRIDDPDQENLMALAAVPQMPPVFPDQNHAVHLRSHYAALNEPEFRNVMGDAGIAQMNQHIQSHQRMLAGLSVDFGEGGGRAEGLVTNGGGQGLPAIPGGTLPGGLLEGSEFTGGSPEGTGTA